MSDVVVNIQLQEPGCLGSILGSSRGLVQVTSILETGLTLERPQCWGQASLRHLRPDSQGCSLLKPRHTLLIPERSGLIAASQHGQPASATSSELLQCPPYPVTEVHAGVTTRHR